MIVTVSGDGVIVGAVYKPVGEIVPQFAPLQPVPETAQFTKVFEVPETDATNCWFVPAITDVLDGVMPTAIAAVAVPLKLIDVVVPLEELLVSVSCPVAVPMALGSN